MSAHLYHQDYMASTDKTCLFCEHVGGAEDFYRVEVDAPGNYQDVCIGCYEDFLDECIQ